MRRRGCAPNAVAYTILLDGICKLGIMEMALELLGRNEKEGGDCSPNVVMDTSVIESFFKKGMVMEGLRVLHRMKAYGCAPSRVTISILIKVLCLKG